MKIIKKGIIDSGLLWIGTTITCEECKAIYKLETTDKEKVKKEPDYYERKYDGRTFYSITCGFCGSKIEFFV